MKSLRMLEKGMGKAQKGQKVAVKIVVEVKNGKFDRTNVLPTNESARPQRREAGRGLGALSH